MSDAGDIAPLHSITSKSHSRYGNDMKHKGDLDERLENWAKAQRYGSAAGSVIGSAEGRYVGDNHEPRSVDAMLVDLDDAELVQEAFRRLMRFDRDVLNFHYVQCMSPPVICRKLKLPRVSDSTFLMALAHAKKAIGGLLGKLAEARRDERDRLRSKITVSPIREVA